MVIGRIMGLEWGAGTGGEEQQQKGECKEQVHLVVFLLALSFTR